MVSRKKRQSNYDRTKRLCSDLSPSAPSCFSRHCPFHSPLVEVWRARRERGFERARATGALRESARLGMSETGCSATIRMRFLTQKVALEPACPLRILWIEPG